jgi:hypothetical protein
MKGLGFVNCIGAVLSLPKDHPVALLFPEATQCPPYQRIIFDNQDFLHIAQIPVKRIDLINAAAST